VICFAKFDERKVFSLGSCQDNSTKLRFLKENYRNNKKDRRRQSSLEWADELEPIQRFLKENTKVIEFFCNREAARY
jgi:hypothetical protein